MQLLYIQYACCQNGSIVRIYCARLCAVILLPRAGRPVRADFVRHISLNVYPVISFQIISSKEKPELKKEPLVMTDESLFWTSSHFPCQDPSARASMTCAKA